MSVIKFVSLFDIDFPLIQAGMGGVASPRLAATVSNAGCLGVVAQYKNNSDEVKRSLKETRDLTSKMFGVNLIPEVSGEELLNNQVEAALETKDRNISFVFYGMPPIKIINRIKDNDLLIIVQVGTYSEADMAKECGVDVLVLQGTEAGGHLLGTQSVESLLTEILQYERDIPLLVSGGISSSKDMNYYLNIGASGFLCGTLFVATHESDAHPLYKEKIVDSTVDDTIITNVFEIGWPGRVHRVLKSETVQKGRLLPANFIGKTQIYDKTYPVPRFSASVPTIRTTGEVLEMALYCGTSCSTISSIESVDDIIKRLKLEVQPVKRFTQKVN